MQVAPIHPNKIVDEDPLCTVYFISPAQSISTHVLSSTSVIGAEEPPKQVVSGMTKDTLYEPGSGTS